LLHEEDDFHVPRFNVVKGWNRRAELTWVSQASRWVGRKGLAERSR